MTCKYCSDYESIDVFTVGSISSYDCDEYELSINGNKLVVKNAYCMSEIVSENIINYCPMCGRRLKSND